MRRFILLSLSLLAFCSLVNAQSNVRAWYAKGQVWILWQTQQPFPQTYGIYKSNQPFTNTNQATAIGRPFAYEYLIGKNRRDRGRESDSKPGVRYLRSGK